MAIAPTAALHERLCPDTMCVTLSYLPFRQCCQLRTVAGFYNSIVTSDDFWSVMCTSRGIAGTLVENPSDYLLEPNPFRRLHGPREKQECILHWQLAVCLWMAKDSCQHLSENALRLGLPAWREAIKRSSLPQTVQQMNKGQNTFGACQFQGCRVKDKANFVCVGCAKRFCTRGGSSHMAEHSNDEKQRGPVENHGVGIMDDDYSCYCYASGGSCNIKVPYKVTSRECIPEDVLEQLLAPRDKTARVNHMGLFLRNECPHLDYDFVQKACNKMYGPLSKKKVYGSCCQYKGCRNNKVYVCLTCFHVACGAGKGGHMAGHSEETGHLLVLAVRRLDCWCYSCDRYLGVGGTMQDSLRTQELRKGFKSPKDISAHSYRPWEIFE